MSEIIQLNQNLEEISCALQARYMILGQDAMVQNDLRLSHGMHKLTLRYKTPGQQLDDFQKKSLLIGNPAIEVITYGRNSEMAAYLHDRDTGLTAVNSFAFEPEEVRPLTKDEYDALMFGFATENIVSPVSQRVLTDTGLARLALDLITVYEKLRL